MRNIAHLHPRAQDLVERLKIECMKKNMIIGIGECLRTVEEQEELYAQGRTKPGNIVTNARGTTYSSQHQWGIAFDFYRNDGTGAYNESGNFFEKVGAIGKSLGLGWGGDWTSIKDRPHLYLPDWGSTTTKLKSLYSTPDKFMATWEGDVNAAETEKETKRDYLQRGDKGSKVKEMQKDLISIGISCGSTGADGHFGQSTEGAVKEFQKKYALAVDGKYGKKSVAKMKEVKKQKDTKTDTTYKVGSVYTLQAEMKVRTGAGTNYKAKKYSELTADGKKQDKDQDGALDKGTRVTCQAIKKVNSDTWMRTPSGWIAAVYNGKTYIV